MTLTHALRDRLDQLATQAQTAAELLEQAEALDLDPDEQAAVLLALDALALRLEHVTDRLARGVDPARLTRMG
jgi:hypothetical protein